MVLEIVHHVLDSDFYRTFAIYYFICKQQIVKDQVSKNQELWKLSVLTEEFKLQNYVSYWSYWFRILISQWVIKSVRLKSTIYSFFGKSPQLLLYYLINNSLRWLFLCFFIIYKVFFVSWGHKNNAFMVLFIHVK